MRKTYFLGLILFGLTTFCYSQNRYYVVPWLQKIFLGFNVLYDYEKLTADDDFNIVSNNILFEMALGYDFGRVVPRFFIDIGLPLSGTVGFINGDEDLNRIMDTENFKLGFEIGLKPIKTQKISMIIPLGVLFCWTTYKQKNPNYADGHPYDRAWDYHYINLFSGINVIFQASKHFKIGLFSRIGFSVKKDEEYKETLRGNYIWTSTNSSTYSVKSDIDILNFSIGIGILANM
jgi:hypothetical protein